MPTLTAVTLLINGLMLTLALGTLFVFILLLQDTRRNVILNTYFILFMLSVVSWSSGSFLSRIAVQVTDDDSLIRSGLYVLEFGFGGACVSGYLIATRLTAARYVISWTSVAIGIAILLIYRPVLILLDISYQYTLNEQDLLDYSFPRVDGIVYFLFSLVTVWIVWQNLVKIKQNAMRIGLLILSLGQLLALLSPRLRSLALGENAGALAAVFIGYAMMQSQIIRPLAGRTRQVGVVEDVGQAIIDVNVDDVLQTIVEQAADLIGVDGSAIYLREGQQLVLKKVHRLPQQAVGTTHLAFDEGAVGMVASKRQAMVIANYRRDWKGAPDMLLASETFGPLACVPLVFDKEVVGVLLVVRGQERRIFDQDDLDLLELLAPLAAVAITNSGLIKRQQELIEERESAKKELEAVLLSTTNPVIAVSRELKIGFMNPAAVSTIWPVYRVTRGSIGNNLLDIINPEVLPKNIRAFLRDVRRSGSYVYEVSINKRDYMCHITQLDTPEGGWVAVLNDVTTLKEIDRLKSQMVQMTSHDLKNPLFALMNYLELVQEDGEEIFTEPIKRNLGAIWAQVNRMRKLIDGILDLERIQGGLRFTEACDLEQILHDTFRNLEDQATRKGIHLSSEIADRLPYVFGDPQQLGQVVANLLDNAIKFTPQGGTISLSAKCPDANTVQIAVADTGIGIPSEAKEKVFDRFYRVKSGRTKDDISSGLGLSLAKAIVEQHKGIIWLESEENKGTIFYVNLPVVKEVIPQLS